MTLEKIGKIKIFEPDITIKVIFDTVFNLFYVKALDIEIQDINKSANIEVYDGEKFTFNNTEENSDVIMNRVNDFLLKKREGDFYICVITYNENNRDYVRKVLDSDDKIKAMCFYSYGASISAVKKYDINILYSYLRKEENSGYLKIFFEIKDREKEADFLEEMDAYFVETEDEKSFDEGVEEEGEGE